MLFRSLWIAAWVIDGVNTHTFGPKVAVSASGHRLDAELGAETTAGVGDEPTTAALAGYRRQHAGDERRREDQWPCHHTHNCTPLCL